VATESHCRLVDLKFEEGATGPMVHWMVLLSVERMLLLSVLLERMLLLQLWF